MSECWLVGSGLAVDRMDFLACEVENLVTYRGLCGSVFLELDVEMMKIVFLASIGKFIYLVNSIHV